MSNVYENTTNSRQKLRYTNPANYAGTLTGREMEVLHLLAEGLSNQDIADMLFLSTNTVRAHLYTIYNKLGVSTRIAAVHKALKGRLLRLDDLQQPDWRSGGGYSAA
jgi:DNA-binding NarL/FixJ family response regulator